MKKQGHRVVYVDPSNYIRKNVYITPEQDRALKRIKRKHFKNESDTIRAALTSYLTKLGVLV